MVRSKTISYLYIALATLTAEIYNLEKVLLAKHTFSILLYHVAVKEVSTQTFETHSCEWIFIGGTKSQGHRDFC